MCETILKITPYVLENFGLMFSRAVRTNLDSKYSVILFNAMRVVPNEVWEIFCDYMDVELKRYPCIVAGGLQKIFAKFDSDPALLKLFSSDNELYKTVTGRTNTYLINMFDAAINCVPLEDCESLLYTFQYWETENERINNNPV